MVVERWDMYESKRKDKKFAITNGIKTIHFGAAGYDDYTMHKNKDRKENYLRRHRKEDWNDPRSAGFWATNLLWNKPSLRGSISDTMRRYDMKIIHHKKTVL